jgi:hypothetical protein
MPLLGLASIAAGAVEAWTFFVGPPAKEPVPREPGRGDPASALASPAPMARKPFAGVIVNAKGEI